MNRLSDAEVSAVLRRATELDVQFAHRAGLLSPALTGSGGTGGDGSWHLAGGCPPSDRRAVGEHPPEGTVSAKRQYEAERHRLRIKKAIVRVPLAVGAAITIGGAVNVGFDPQMTAEASIYAVGGGMLSGVATLLTRWEPGGRGRRACAPPAVPAPDAPAA